MLWTDVCGDLYLSARYFQVCRWVPEKREDLGEIKESGGIDEELGFCLAEDAPEIAHLLVEDNVKYFGVQQKITI